MVGDEGGVKSRASDKGVTVGIEMEESAVELEMKEESTVRLQIKKERAVGLEMIEESTVGLEMKE
jgi:hypothetical protein